MEGAAAHLRVGRALPEDLPIILAVQKMAFLSQAALYADPSLPPLVQTLDDMLAECRDKVVLKAESGGDIIGSVRAAQDDDGVCRIGRLVVLPPWQGQGVGTALMRAMEDAFPTAARYSIFTGHKSVGTIRLYEKLGYEETGREPVSGRVTHVRMEKPGQG